MPELRDDTTGTPVLTEHALEHLGPLPVSSRLLSCRFAAGCAMSNCRGACCSGGVSVDLRHRDRVLAEAPLVLRYMDATQERDATKWFEAEEIPDGDFPSGAAASTRVVNGGCVFLDARGFCVLHAAEAESPGLKPFFCRTYPVALVNGVLTVEYDYCPDETQCCGPVHGGQLTIFDVCADELAFMLGERGARELRAAVGTGGDAPLQA
jgi:Fe-S-cluster containining protein